MTREIIAYALIGAVALVGAVWGGVAWRSHSRNKLRRRGIKRYGH
jgi:hypothetical protein